MSDRKVSIQFSPESLEHFALVLQGRPAAAAVHCGDDDGGLDILRGTGSMALGVHCGDEGRTDAPANG